MYEIRKNCFGSCGFDYLFISFIFWWKSNCKYSNNTAGHKVNRLIIY